MTEILPLPTLIHAGVGIRNGLGDGIHGCHKIGGRWSLEVTLESGWSVAVHDSRECSLVGPC